MDEATACVGVIPSLHRQTEYPPAQHEHLQQVDPSIYIGGTFGIHSLHSHITQQCRLLKFPQPRSPDCVHFILIFLRELSSLKHTSLAKNWNEDGTETHFSPRHPGEQKNKKIKISRTGGEYASVSRVLGDQRICQVLGKVMRTLRNW